MIDHCICSPGVRTADCSFPHQAIPNFKIWTKIESYIFEFSFSELVGCFDDDINFQIVFLIENHEFVKKLIADTFSVEVDKVTLFILSEYFTCLGQ
jgi:hypothetical protein